MATQSNAAHMKVEIWSDIVCPWCYIGKRHVEKALELFEHRADVDVVWRSYELDPTAARSYPGTLNEMLAKKMGMSVEQAAAANARVSRLAAAAGLDYHLDIAQHGNTFDAHRLVHLAATHGLQDVLEERLMKAYFSEGKPIGDTETLLALAVEVGIGEEETRAALESSAFAEEVRADEERAAMLGLRGVPAVVIDEKYGVSGARPTETFLSVFQKVWAESHPLTMLNGLDDAGSCEGDSCALPE